MLSKIAIGTLALTALAGNANADSISITSQNFVGNAPIEGTPTPASTTGLFQNVTGSFPSITLSPYAFNTGPGPDGSAAANTVQYSVLNLGGSSSLATAVYNINDTSFSMVWGSPDIYNEARFYSGANGTGSLIDVVGGATTTNYNGTNLACYGTVCTQTLFDLLTFTDTGGLIGSVILADTGQAAFEYTIIPNDRQFSSTPLPGAIWLFASGLGILGFAKRRKQSSTLSAFR
jgi:hypothetical protein